MAVGNFATRRSLLKQPTPAAIPLTATEVGVAIVGFKVSISKGGHVLHEVEEAWEETENPNRYMNEVMEAREAE
ncbi:hypothetical protein [Aureimonas frigidaquae]|uniref:hypothetical protein n=1 Tax=Aureimonas frigidaquae TaxID=424757 RepID=UPI000A41E7B8|nr:hypothetical protein [Aureimonas frigidaquae]